MSKLKVILLSTLSATALTSVGATSAFAQEAPPEEPAAGDAAPAEEPSDLEKAKAHFVKGNEFFQAKDYENAVVEFKKAYKLTKNALLLYNIAFTLDEIGDKEMALFYYDKFIAATEEGAPNREIAVARVKEMRASAKKGTQKGGQDFASVSTFKHNVVDEAPPGMPIDVTAVIPQGVDWIVVLHYRAQGEVKFTSVQLKPRYNELVARIPKTATTGTTVQYYIEVRDGADQVLERSGQPASPNIVFLEKGAKARYYPDLVPGSGDGEKPGGLGSGSSQSGATMTGDGGWTDVQSSKFQKLKWGTTAGSAGLVLLSASFYFLSGNAADELESESVDSRTEDCISGPPCRSFSAKQKDLQSAGQAYETLGTVSLGLGVAAAGVAGYLWYKEATGGAKSESKTLTTLPMVGDDVIGAAATWSF